MFNPLVKVFKPKKEVHDLSFTSLVSSNIGSLELVFAKHFFAGENVKVGMEHLIKFAPMLAPIFQKYDLRFDSFVVPDRLVWSDSYKFYKGGKDGMTDYPAPSVAVNIFYRAVLLSRFYGVNGKNLVKSSLRNALTGSLVDMLNLPTFDEVFTEEFWQKFHDGVFHGSDWNLVDSMVAYVTSRGVEIDSVSFAGYRRRYPFYTGDSDLQLLRQLHALCVVFISDEIYDYSVEIEDPKLVSLVPALQYQYVWSEYYRNQFVQDNSNSDIPAFGDDPDEDPRNAFWLNPSVDVAKDFLSDFYENIPMIYNSSEETYIPLPVFLQRGYDWNVEGYSSTELLEVHFWEDMYSGLISDNAYSNGLPNYLSFQVQGGIYHFSEMVMCLENIFGVKDVNFAKDYFTSASLDSQLGPVVRMPLGDLTPVIEGATPYSPVYTNGKNQITDDGSSSRVASIPEDQFGTIPDLRNASIMEKLAEKLALAGNRPLEWFRVLFGHAPSDERLNRPQFLGREKSYLNISEIIQTSASEVGQPLGDMAGNARSVNTYGLFDVNIDEPSYVFVMMSIVPKQAYFQGFPVELMKTDRYDFLLPDFQSVGMRAIDKSELFASASGIFGYTDRYQEYKCSNDEIHGEFRSNLAYWHSSRLFASSPGLNGQFVSMQDKSDLNRIFAVTDNMTAHVFGIVHFNVKANRPLEVYPNYSL